MRVGEIGEVATGKPVNRDLVRILNVMRSYMRRMKEMEQSGTMPPELATKSVAQRAFRAESRKL
jgi:hypothetical protein